MVIPPATAALARRAVPAQLSRALSAPVPEAAVLGLHQLCHDLAQEVMVMEHLVSHLMDGHEPSSVERALLGQVSVLQATLRETRLPSLPVPVALRGLTVAAAATFRLVHEGSLVVRARDEAIVLGISSEIRRALVNLLDNARLAAPRGAIEVSLQAAGEDVVLEVEDDGSGTVTASGSGLGMAVVRDVARRHGGSVTHHRSSLGGQAIGLRLPRVSE